MLPTSLAALAAAEAPVEALKADIEVCVAYEAAGEHALAAAVPRQSRNRRDNRPIVILLPGISAEAPRIMATRAGAALA